MRLQNQPWGGLAWFIMKTFFFINLHIFMCLCCWTQFYVNKKNPKVFPKKDVNSSFVVGYLDLESDLAVVQWKQSLVMAFKFVYQRAPWPTSIHHGFTQSDLCSTFSPVFLPLTHFDSPQFPQWPIGSNSEPNKTYPIRSTCISGTNHLEKMKDMSGVASAEGNTGNDMFRKGGRRSEAPISCCVPSYGWHESKRGRSSMCERRDESVISW